MRIIECKCPSCGGNLDINSDTEYLTCNFCDARLYVERVVKPVEKVEKSDNEKRVEYISYFDKLLEKCRDCVKDLKENKNVVVNDDSSDSTTRGYVEISFFPSKVYNNDFKLPCVFNGLLIDYYKFNENNDYIEEKYREYTPENYKYYDYGYHKELYDNYQKYASFNDEQKAAIKNYLYYLSKISAYAHALERYAYMSQLKKQSEDGKPLEGYWNAELGDFTITSVMRERDRNEKEMLEIMKEIHDYELNKSSNSKNEETIEMLEDYSFDTSDNAYHI